MTKAENGAGSVFYHKQRHRWVAVVTWPGGKRTTKSFEAQAGEKDERGHRQAIRARDQMLKERDAGLQPGADRQTLKAYLTDWLTQRKRRLTDRSLDQYDAALARICEHIGHVRLSHLSADHVQTAVNAIEDAISPARAAYCRSILSMALTQAVAKRLLPGNPVAGTDVPDHTPRKPPPLSVEDARKLLAAFRREPDGALYTFALATGMRLHEMLGLRWGDIDEAQQVATVTHQLYRKRGGGWEFRPLKTKQSPVVVLSRVALDALAVQKRHQATQRRKAGERWQECGFVFTSRHGQPHVRNSVEARLHRLLAEAGLPDLRVHDLRHGKATLHLALRTDRKVVSDMLGHRDGRTTERVYQHTPIQLHREAADELDRALKEEAG